jgi:hypothetical protein
MMSRVGELVGDFNINPIKNESTLHILGGDARKLIAHHSQPLLWSGSNPHERKHSARDPRDVCQFNLSADSIPKAFPSMPE